MQVEAMSRLSLTADSGIAVPIYSCLSAAAFLSAADAQPNEIGY